jgi:hypothetical protein
MGLPIILLCELSKLQALGGGASGHALFVVDTSISLSFTTITNADKYVTSFSSFSFLFVWTVLLAGSVGGGRELFLLENSRKEICKNRALTRGRGRGREPNWLG